MQVFFVICITLFDKINNSKIIVKNKDIWYNESMKVRFNENKEIVEKIQEGLKLKNGYCPCKREIVEENKCMCKEFRDQIADPNFEGYCHCMLYYKEK